MRVVRFSGYELTDLSRLLFVKDIFEYHLRTLVGKSNTPEEVLRGITADLEYGDIFVDYKDELISQYDGVTEELQAIMSDKPLVNMLCQLRIISINPITIYHRLIENELRRDFFQAVTDSTKVKMSELIVPTSIDRTAVGKMTFEPIQTTIKDIKRPEKKTVRKQEETFEAKTISEGHIMIDLKESDVYLPGQVSWKEGPLADAYPKYTEKTIDDYEGGVVISVVPGCPLYAYPHINMYPAVEDLNRMIEAGNQVYFLNTGSDEEIRACASMFNNWGITVVDYVTEERLLKNGIKIHGAHILRPFYVIQRPQHLLHNAAWAGISNDRRRGLPGIPWAIRKTEKPGLFDIQPDDGFLSYWLRDAQSKYEDGNGAVQVYFPLLTIIPLYKIKSRVVKPFEDLLDRQLYFTHYPEQGVGSVFLKNMGEWIAFRTLMRKYI